MFISSQEWPETVIGVVGEFNSNEEAAATIEKVWTAAGGTVHHVCNSLGFGAVAGPYSESTYDDMLESATTHSGARLRAHPLCAAKLLNVEGASLTTLSGAFAHGTHTFDGGSGFWGAAVGGALYMQSNFAVAAEVRDKKAELRSSAAVVHILVSKNGETAQQFGMPADADSSIHLGKSFVAIALDAGAANGHCYELTDWGVCDAFVNRIFHPEAQAAVPPPPPAPKAEPPAPLQVLGPQGLLDGKTCVVLGGTGNVGAGVAYAYAQEGATVVITGRSQAPHLYIIMYIYI
jgi:hypothetical protein